jgi:transketolase
MRDTMRQRFIAAAGDLLEADDRVVVVLAVISHGLFADAGLTERFGDRIIDVGIREQLQVGVAGGLALEGFTPIITGYAPFLVERAFEQLKLSVTHQGVRAIAVSIGASWDASGEGRTHQAPEDVALMATLPGWDVHVPGHPDELELLLRHAHRSDRSAYIRSSTEANAQAHLTTPGRVVTLRRGSAASPTVLAVGPTADATLEAVADLDATVLYTATVVPFDERGLRARVVGDELILIEPYLSGTSTGRVARALSDRPMRIRSHGVEDPEMRRYGTPADHRRLHRLDRAGIREFVLGEGTTVGV